MNFNCFNSVCLFSFLLYPLFCMMLFTVSPATFIFLPSQGALLLCCRMLCCTQLAIYVSLDLLLCAGQAGWGECTGFSYTGVRRIMGYLRMPSQLENVTWQFSSCSELRELCLIFLIYYTINILSDSEMHKIYRTLNTLRTYFINFPYLHVLCKKHILKTWKH